MTAGKKKENQSRIIGCAAFCAAALFTAFFVFYRLGAGEIMGFDEGRHAVNALEMYENGDLIVNTYNGETDYFNLKPPFSMYLIMINCAIFGKNLFAIRFGSACCYFLTALLSALYVCRKKGWYAGSFTLLLFGCSKQLLLRSMARTGDANALYQLFATSAMLLLLLLCERKKEEGRKALLLCGGIGLCCAAAFLTKSFHAGIPFLTVLIVFLFLGRKNIGWKEWSIFAGATACPVLLWAFLRWLRDGSIFLKEMLLEDVFHRSTAVIAGTDGGFFCYFGQLFSENTTLVVLFLLGICAAFWLYASGEGTSQKTAGKKGAVYLTLTLWVLLPCLLFAIPKTKLYTYVYASYIALYVAGGLVLPSLFKRGRKYAETVVVVAACLFGGVMLGMNISSIAKYIEKECPDSFERLLLENEELFSGTGHIYSTNRNERMGDVWLQDELLAVKLYTELTCVDGGTEGYQADTGECWLVLNYIWSSEEEKEAAEAATGVILYEDKNFKVLKKNGNTKEE